MTSSPSLTSLEPTDRRTEPRRRILTAGKLYMGAFSLTVVDCLVIELSTQGARAETPVMTQVPDLLKIQVGGAPIRNVRRCWAKGNIIGLEFFEETPARKAVISSIAPPRIPTMSSCEIAELTGTLHVHVMRDVHAMLAELYCKSNFAKFKGVYMDDNGESCPCFNLPKRETLILISGYSVELRSRIIDRWQEIEEQKFPLAPQTYAEALRLAADLEEQKAQAEAKLAVEQAKTDGLHEFTPRRCLHSF